MMRPPRTAHLAAALISAVAVMVLTLCTTLFLRSYRNAIVEAARTNSAQAVSQVVGAVGNYVDTMESAVTIVMADNPVTQHCGVHSHTAPPCGSPFHFTNRSEVNSARFKVLPPPKRLYAGLPAIRVRHTPLLFAEVTSPPAAR